MIVVADTSPLRYLAEIDAVTVLPRLYGTILIPPAVLTELSADSTPLRARSLSFNRPAWLEIRLPSLEVPPTAVDLDAGEREAITLALELRANLLIDERLGRKRATELGLDNRGTLAVLVTAADKGLLDLRDSFDRLMQTGFRISPFLRGEMLERIEQYPKKNSSNLLG